jgi:hypothetical protein
MGDFNAKRFFWDVTAGEYDGRLHEVLGGLTIEQMEELLLVAMAHVRSENAKSDSATAGE